MKTTIQRIPIPASKFSSELFDLFNRQWFLLTAGDHATGEVNCMTVSWGFLGVIWNRPVAMALVRPQRFTLEFMDRFDTFTLAAFPETMRGALELCGTKSGRDLDKIQAAHLTPVPSVQVAAPGYAEAELIIECRKLYRGTLDPAGFTDPEIPSQVYPGEDFHKMFIGGIEHISGVECYSSPR